MWPGELYAAWVNRSNPTNDANSYIITQDKLPIINAAAVAACDAKDGLKDGLIDDPRLCRFDPTTIVCKKGQTADCITAEQAEVVKKVYAGLYYSTSDKKFGPGKMFWPGYEPGSELQWWGHIGDPLAFRRPTSNIWSGTTINTRAIHKTPSGNGTPSTSRCGPTSTTCSTLHPRTSAEPWIPKTPTCRRSWRAVAS
jgi:hypothetical protein